MMDEVASQGQNVHEEGRTDSSSAFSGIDSFGSDTYRQTFNLNYNPSRPRFIHTNLTTSVVHDGSQDLHMYIHDSVKNSLGSKPTSRKCSIPAMQTTQGNVFGFGPVPGLSDVANGTRNTQNLPIYDEIVPNSTSYGQASYKADNIDSCNDQHQSPEHETSYIFSTVPDDKELMKTVSSDNAMASQGGMKKPQNNEGAETNTGSHMKIVLVTNGDVSEEIKLPLSSTQRAAGKHKTTVNKDIKRPFTSSDSFSDHICGFTSLQSSIDEGSVKRKRAQPFESTTSTSSVDSLGETLHKLSNRLDIESHSILVAVEKPENGDGSKKTKLSVEQVYKSDEDCEMESDGDITKDLLKVKMSKCDKCSMHFLGNKKFKAHQRSHKKSDSPLYKWYSCEVCGATFNRREHWKRHELIHTNEFPYTCKICNRGFKRAEHVKRHQSVHTQDKPHLCTECDKRFTRAEHLRKHMKTHALDYIGGKPYPRITASATSDRENVEVIEIQPGN